MAMLKSCLLLFLIFSVGNAEVTFTKDVNGLNGLDELDGLNGLDADLARKCPATWIKFKDRCYKFFSHPAKWIQAEKNCQSLGANLASIRMKRENDFLLSLVPRSTATWIGAHEALDGHWIWTDGIMFLYTHWCAGEPNSNPRCIEKCLEINFSSKRCWNDRGCAHARPYICAMQLRDPQATAVTSI